MGSCQSLQQEHYANLGRKHATIVEKCNNNSWQLGKSITLISGEVQVISGKMHMQQFLFTVVPKQLVFQRQCWLKPNMKVTFMFQYTVSIQIEITPQLVAARMHEHKWVWPHLQAMHDHQFEAKPWQKIFRLFNNQSCKRIYCVHITNRYHSKLIKASLDQQHTPRLKLLIVAGATLQINTVYTVVNRIQRMIQFNIT